MVDQKKALTKLWKDTFSVTEYQEKLNSNGSTGFEEVQTFENQPCKLSFSTLKETNQNDDNAKLVQVTKLFCDNLLQIRAGSKITVKHGEKAFVFSQSGEPGIFSVHQEIVLVPFKGWA